MSSTTLIPTARVNPERLAWGVLLISFAIFCTLCVATTIGVYFFFFQSTIPMDVLMLVGRGTVITTKSGIEQPVREQSTYLTSSTIISTDPQSQATIMFRDSEHSGRLVAAVTLKRESSLTFNAATLPRFEWSVSEYAIDLSKLAGELDVLVAENIGGSFSLSIQTTQGERITFNKSGSYIVNASDTQVKVINRNGEAIMFTPDPREGRSIPTGMQGIIDRLNSRVTVIPAYTDLLGNSTFEDISTDDSDVAAPILPAKWGCYSTADASPRGVYRSEMKDGRLAVRLVRNQGASSHGETGCRQYFPGQLGLDTRSYESLSLRATFFVNYQSLSTCGIAGSECPLMLKMEYIDVNGNPRQWFHGFYTSADPQAGYPTICSSCTQDHERLYEKAWYTYDSGNLYTLFKPEERPASILYVEFYASGHQYDVFVGEVALLALQAASSS